MSKNLRKVTLLFFIAAAVYALAACLLRHAPYTVIDESLYTNLARSLLWEGRAAYRSQPIDYPYLLYPLLLVPVYWLQSLLGGDVYRYVQVFNALLITSSVFPVYLLARETGAEEKRALQTSLLTVLLPDMLMCAYEMTEALIWPLALWLMLFAYRLTAAEKVRYGVLTGLFTGLLYAVKPGAVAMGAGFMLALLAVNIKKKKRVGAVLAGMGVTVLILALVHGLFRFVFGGESSFIGLYGKQTSDWSASHIGAAALGLVYMAVGFAMAGGGVFVFTPYIMRRSLGEEGKKYLGCTTVGLLSAMLGTAILVVPFGWSGKIGDVGLQLRYITMFLPVFFVLTFAAKEQKRASRLPFKRTMLLFTLAAALLGLKLALYPAASGTVDALSLGAFTHNSYFEGTATGIIFTVVFCLVMLLTGLYEDPNNPRRFQKICLRVVPFFLIFNLVTAAFACRLPVEEAVRDDALQLNGWLMETEQTPLGITQRRYADVLSYRLEAHLNRPMQQVTIDQLVASMSETGGVYVPFVPMDQSPNKNNGLTPQTRTLVLGETVFSQLELAEGASARLTDHGLYALVTLPESGRWLDSVLYGLDDSILDAGTQAILLLFKQLPENAMLRLRLRAPTAGTVLTVTRGSQTETYTLNGSEALTLPLTAAPVYLSASADITVEGYSVE